MTVRLIEWQVPYTWGTAIEITPDKVINLLLRAENNLLHVNDDNELYCDLQLDSGIAPTDDFPVWVTTGIVNQSDGRSQNGLLLRYQTTSWAYAQWLYGADWNLYYDGWTWVWKQVLYSDQIMTILQDYIKWTDFHFVNKTWQTNITLSDMSTAISPTADFTINAPDPVEDGYVYLLRVSSWVSPYTMTLWSNISNPYNVDLTLTVNWEDMFAFLAVGWLLELQPEIDVSDVEYGPSWDWIHYVAPSKNVIYHFIETNLNTKTFYLADTSDLTTAQAVYDWYIAWKYPIIFYNDQYYMISQAVQSTSMTFYSCKYSFSTDWVTITNIDTYELSFILINWDGEVTSIATNQSQVPFLQTDVDYSTPYTPTYAWSPATKKYVDDKKSTISVTLEAANWSSKNITVTATWVTSSNTVIVAPDPSDITDYADNCVYCSAQGTDSLTFTCDTEPTSDLIVNVVILN